MYLRVKGVTQGKDQSNTVTGECENQKETSFSLSFPPIKKTFHCSGEGAGIGEHICSKILESDFSSLILHGNIQFTRMPSIPELAAHLTCISLLRVKAAFLSFDSMMALPPDLATYFVISPTFWGIYHSTLLPCHLHHLLGTWSAAPCLLKVMPESLHLG